jgi:PAS domain S-box-containing protein
MNKNPLTILIVEDDPNLLMASSHALLKLHYSVLEAEDLKTCSAQLDRIHPDLILMDIMLPDGNGIEFLSRYMTDNPDKTCPVLFLSGQKPSMDQTWNEHPSGAVDFMVKPVRAEDLQQRVNSIFRIQAFIDKKHSVDKQLASVLRLASDMILVIDSESLLRSISPSFELITGYQPFEWMSKSISGFVYCDDQVLVEEKLKKAFQNQYVEPFEVRIENLSGKIIPMLFNLTKLEEGKQTIGVMITGKNLSSEKLEAYDLSNGQGIRELSDLVYLSKSTTPHTAEIYDSNQSFVEGSEIFNKLLNQYKSIIDQFLEKRIYRVESNASRDLKAMANTLGFLKAGPKDVIRIQKAFIEEQRNEVITKKNLIYLEESRIALLELMGYLAAYYRNRT